jgi:hypothetical protein
VSHYKSFINQKDEDTALTHIFAVRKVKTKSGATAVQVLSTSWRQCFQIGTFLAKDLYPILDQLMKIDK